MENIVSFCQFGSWLFDNRLYSFPCLLTEIQYRMSSVRHLFEDHLVAWTDEVTEVHQKETCVGWYVSGGFAVKCTCAGWEVFLACWQKYRLSSVHHLFEEHLVAWTVGVTEVQQRETCAGWYVSRSFAMKCTCKSDSVAPEFSSLRFRSLFSWDTHLSLLYVACVGKGEDGRR
jgi:hypothetical protein